MVICVRVHDNLDPLYPGGGVRLQKNILTVVKNHICHYDCVTIGP
jgi:hypothetical protein